MLWFGLDSSGSVCVLMASSCVRNNEPSASIKFWKMLLSTYATLGSPRRSLLHGIMCSLHFSNRLQRGVRHELSSLARILGSWVQIPLNAWMSVFILCLCQVAALRTGGSPAQGVLPNVLDQETEVKRSVSRMPYAPSGTNRNKPSSH
jgi:hypothetical protein